MVTFNTKFENAIRYASQTLTQVRSELATLGLPPSNFDPLPPDWIVEEAIRGYNGLNLNSNVLHEFRPLRDKAGEIDP